MTPQSVILFTFFFLVILLHQVLFLRHKRKHLVQLIHPLLSELLIALILQGQLTSELFVHVLDGSPLQSVLSGNDANIDLS